MELLNQAYVTNFNEGTIQGSLTQSADATQSTLLENVIDVGNSGSIDPLIGISASITNLIVDLSNEAGILNTNLAQVYGASQTASAEQSNTHELGVADSGEIVATDFGIHAVISNSDVELRNDADIDNINQGDVEGSLIQIG